MKPLHLTATKSTPEVWFEPESNILRFLGQSYPENAFKFYEPIFGWVDECLKQLEDQALTIEMQLPYINTSSTKCIMMMLEKFDEAHSEGKRVALNWYYDPENENELECAEEFKEDLSLPFRIIPKAAE
ncbi:DUF1987 domain-containing protein [Gorillibacterium sp. sgz5001074]|uniref:DUF1987 domain-containing protein n=1 Tax=Gorillibacterium sp. sgz5001074 TaxID=3446695 RepID=UPI003F663AC6